MEDRWGPYEGNNRALNISGWIISGICIISFKTFLRLSAEKNEERLKCIPKVMLRKEIKSLKLFDHRPGPKFQIEKNDE